MRLFETISTVILDLSYIALSTNWQLNGQYYCVLHSTGNLAVSLPAFLCVLAFGSQPRTMRKKAEQRFTCAAVVMAFQWPLDALQSVCGLLS